MKREHPGQLRLLCDTPRARAEDPETSHRAAAAIKASGVLAGHQHLVLRLVQRHPGCTSAELARRYVAEYGGEFGSWRVRVARRMKELEPTHIVRGIPTRCAATGMMATTWYPVKREGEAA